MEQNDTSILNNYIADDYVVIDVRKDARCSMCILSLYRMKLNNYVYLVFYFFLVVALERSLAMRVLEVIPSFEPLGGAENFVFNLSLALKTCVEVYVVSLYDDENIYISNCLRQNGIEIIYLNKN